MHFLFCYPQCNTGVFKQEIMVSGDVYLSLLQSTIQSVLTRKDMIIIISMTVTHFIVFLFLCDSVTSCCTVFFSEDKINTGNLLHDAWLGHNPQVSDRTYD